MSLEILPKNRLVNLIGVGGREVEVGWVGGWGKEVEVGAGKSVRG